VPAAPNNITLSPIFHSKQPDLRLTTAVTRACTGNLVLLQAFLFSLASQPFFSVGLLLLAGMPVSFRAELFDLSAEMFEQCFQIIQAALHSGEVRLCRGRFGECLVAILKICLRRGMLLST
jgi:hypothetical protein